MVRILQVILGASFLGIAVIILKDKIGREEFRKAFQADGARLIKILKKFFGQAGSMLRLGLRRLRPLATLLAGYLKRGGPFAVKGLRLGARVVKRTGIKVIHIIKNTIETFRRDLKTFEVPGHKEDFFDRLQEKSDKKEHVREQRYQEEEEEPLFVKEDELAVRDRAPIVVKKSHIPILQEQELPESVFSEEQGVDVKILKVKEQNLLEAIIKNPKNPNFYKKLGKIYLQMQHLEDAKQCFEYALKLGAQDPELRSLLLINGVKK